MKLEYIGKSKHPLKDYPAHRHNTWELIYNARGRGIISADEVDHPYEEGTIFLCPPGVSHYKSADTAFDDYYIQFSGCPFLPKTYCLRDDCESRIGQLIRILYSTYNENKSWSACDNIFSALMCMLEPQLSGAASDQFVQKLQHILISEFSDTAFELQKAIARIPVNEDHLRRRFKKNLGLTPHAYLTHLRMENAKHLLRGSQASIAEIAYRCGYCDSLYFSRAFRKYTGVAPSQWK